MLGETERTFEIKLTISEALLLEDKMGKSPIEEFEKMLKWYGFPSDDYERLTCDLGRLILVEEDEARILDLSLDDAYFLRSLVSFRDVIGNEPVGIGLLQKLWSAMLEEYCWMAQHTLDTEHNLEYTEAKERAEEREKDKRDRRNARRRELYASRKPNQDK